jgi:glycine betaine/proline transport system substrate-binding protein
MSSRLPPVLAGSVLVFVMTACGSGNELISFRNERPGEGTTVYMGQATWDTGWFQAQIYKVLLEELGYEVKGPYTLDNIAFHFFAAGGHIDFWANGWFPLHDKYFDYQQVRGLVRRVGIEVDQGALQGYLIDKATADEFGITNLGDLRDPEIAALFDINADGKADLIGCEEAWRCDDFIDHHLATYRLENTITHVQGSYRELMEEVIARYENHRPVLFYTWTPNWTISELVIGEDVVWLSVPFGTSPDKGEVSTAAEDVHGCLETPCELGFEVNDIRAVAGVGFLRDNPSAASLLEVIQIPLNEIAVQNALMWAGESSEEDIYRHAMEWVDANRVTVDRWLATARAAD